jgi:hypothetical protein
MSDLSLPDEDEIRSARPISQKEIEEVVELHLNLQKGTLYLVEIAFKIGFKLSRWKDLIPHGKWLKWLEQNAPQISDRTASRYLRLWDNSDWLMPKLKSANVADSDEISTIRQAEALIQEKEANKPRGKIKRKVASFPKPKEEQASLQPVRDIQAETVPSRRDETPEPAAKLDSPDSPDSEEEPMEDNRPILDQIAEDSAKRIGEQMLAEVELKQVEQVGITYHAAKQKVSKTWERITRGEDGKAVRHLAYVFVDYLFKLFPSLQDEPFGGDGNEGH